MHAQAGCGIDLDDAAVLFFQGLLHRLAHHVHTANVETDHLCRRNDTGCQIGMHLVGDVGGRAASRQIGIVAQHHAQTFGRD